MNTEQFKAELLRRAKRMQEFLESESEAGDIPYKSADAALDEASAELPMQQYATMVERCGGAVSLMDWLQARMTTHQMTLEQIADKLYDELDNAAPGTVFDFGLQHNGYWVRVVKFDANNYIYAAQSDSYDVDPEVGTLEDAAEYAEFQADIVADREQMIEASK